MCSGAVVVVSAALNATQGNASVYNALPRKRDSHKDQPRPPSIVVVQRKTSPTWSSMEVRGIAATNSPPLGSKWARLFGDPSSSELFLSVLLGVSLPRFFGVLPGMNGMPRSGMCMMGRFFVLPTVMMLRRFAVMAGGMSMVFRGLPMVLSCFLGHAISSLFWKNFRDSLRWVRHRSLGAKIKHLD